jgi:4'-phosphopantetheinyl transferase
VSAPHPRAWGLATSRLTAAELERFGALLDAAERRRAEALAPGPQRAAYVAAHGALRLLLSSMTGVDPRAWSFARGRHGKPCIDGSLQAGDVRFSLAHTDGFAAVAAAFGRDVGIDAEALDRAVDADGIAARHFTRRERGGLVRLGAAERRRRFFRLWTVKEAVLKAAGTGLRTPLDAFDVRLRPLGIVPHDPALGSPEHWSVRTFRATRRHVVAFAYRDERPDAGKIAVRLVRTNGAEMAC